MWLSQSDAAIDRRNESTRFAQSGGQNAQLQQLQGLYDSLLAGTQGDSPNPTGYMAPASSKIEKAWIPGVTEAGQIFNQGLPPLDPNNYLNQAMANIAAQNNTFMDNLAQYNAANPYAQQLSGLNTSNPFSVALAGTDTSNPYAQSLSGMDTSNPFAASLGGIDTTNPFAGLLGGYGAQANPYADELFNLGAENIRDRLNSTFGRAGQGLSPQNFNMQSDALADFGAKFYGGIYDASQSRLLDALQSGGSLYGQGVGQNISALQSGGGLYGQGVGQGLSALGQAGSLYGQGVGQGIDAYQAGGGLYGQGVGQGINALGQAGSLYGTGAGQNLSALTSGAGLQNQMNYAPLTLFPDVMNLQQSQPYANLNQYVGAVSPLLGTSPPPDRDSGTSGWDKLMGLGGLALGFAGL